MQKDKKTNSWFHVPKPAWKLIVAWTILQPLAATPLLMMVFKVGPFRDPFIVNGPVVLPGLVLAVLPLVLLIQGSGILAPVPSDKE